MSFDLPPSDTTSSSSDEPVRFRRKRARSDESTEEAAERVLTGSDQGQGSEKLTQDVDLMQISDGKTPARVERTSKKVLGKRGREEEIDFDTHKRPKKELNPRQVLIGKIREAKSSSDFAAHVEFFALLHNQRLYVDDDTLLPELLQSLGTTDAATRTHEGIVQVHRHLIGIYDGCTNPEQKQSLIEYIFHTSRADTYSDDVQFFSRESPEKLPALVELYDAMLINKIRESKSSPDFAVHVACFDLLHMHTLVLKDDTLLPEMLQSLRASDPATRTNEAIVQLHRLFIGIYESCTNPAHKHELLDYIFQSSRADTFPDDVQFFSRACPEKLPDLYQMHHQTIINKIREVKSSRDCGEIVACFDLLHTHKLYLDDDALLPELLQSLKETEIASRTEERVRQLHQLLIGIFDGYTKPDVQQQLSNLIYDTSTKETFTDDVQFFTRALPERLPALYTKFGRTQNTELAKSTTLPFSVSRDAALVFIKSLPITATDAKIDTFLNTIRKGRGYDFDRYNIQSFILQYYDPSKSVEYGNFSPQLAAIIRNIIEYVPTQRSSIQQKVDTFRQSAKGKVLSDREIKKIKKIAAFIHVYQIRWERELGDLTAYQGLKITKKVSGLAYGISIEFNEDINAYALYIKVKGKEPSGTFKRVMFPLSWGSQQEVAFAVPHKKARSDEELKALQKEGQLHEKVKDCPNVVRGRFRWFVKWSAAGVSAKKSAAIIYENMSMGSLGSLLNIKEKFSARELKQIATGAALGVSQLHRLPTPICHQDIKPDNILLHRDRKKNITSKLADLGLSREHAHGHVKGDGSPIYMSPEKRLMGGGNGKTDDVWALGITFYELYYGGLPPALQRISTLAELDELLRTDPKSIREYNAPQKGTFKHLIWRMLDPNPATRPAIDEVLKILNSLQDTAFART